MRRTTQRLTLSDHSGSTPVVGVIGNGITTFIQAAQEEGVCIKYYQEFEQAGTLYGLTKVLETVKYSTSNITVAHREVRVLATELYIQNITRLQWVGSDAWITETHQFNVLCSDGKYFPDFVLSPQFASDIFIFFELPANFC